MEERKAERSEPIYLKEPHTALFVGQTGCGKTEKALRLLETEYKEHFDFVVIISPTLKWNETYRQRKWFWTDPNVRVVEPGDRLFDWIKAYGLYSQASKLYSWLMI